jgi:HAD superfamily hydrolase (TIGR01509 family)
MSEQNHPKAVIWDLDGVLADTAELHYRSWRVIMREEYRRDLDYDHFARAVFGYSNDQTLPMLLEHPVAPEELARVVEMKEAAFRREAREHLRPIPGTLALIEALRLDGWRQAIGTSAPRENLAQITALLDLDSRVDVQVCVDDVGAGKPDPAIFLHAAWRLGVSPARCIVIEDSPIGVVAAHAAGMRCVAVATTTTLENLVSADYIANSPALLDPAIFTALLVR